MTEHAGTTGVLVCLDDCRSRRRDRRDRHRQIPRDCGSDGTIVSPPPHSNIGLSDWGRFLGDATLTAAILDQLAMHAIRIDTRLSGVPPVIGRPDGLKLAVAARYRHSGR